MIEPTFEYPALTRSRRAKLLNYAQKALKAQQAMLTPEGKNILHYTLRDQELHSSMLHYPKGDRIDHSTGAQYFYHCHREDMTSTEHGHFHCFFRYPHIPNYIKPTPLPDWDKYIDNPMTHLVAIGMNQLGEPIRLFSVNRWITSEVWYDAKHTNTFINRFKMTLTDDPYWNVLDQWVEAMLHLFSPQIAWLNQRRDDAILLHKKKITAAESVYEDESIEELSDISINLTQQIQWILE
ncbi:MAG: DUF6969 family protein [Legionellaceae bacterium]